jgi:uncharacterized membrane protein YfcA
MSSHSLPFVLITFAAASVNGALGYGFSSITVPLALLLVASRVLNPALVLVELALNACVLVVDRAALPEVWRRMTPLAAGLVPGVAVGTLAVAAIHPDWLKLWTFMLLLPLILIQAAGLRRPLRSERRWHVPCGAGIGALYALTTISGPPLALLLNNQGLGRREFRASLGLIRVIEATLTAAAYWYAGLFTREALSLTPLMIPGLLAGVPLGAWVIRRVRAETFRRVCMSFDAWVVAFGIATLLRLLQIVEGPEAYGVVGAIGAIDGVLLYRFVHAQRRSAEALAC